MYCSWSQGGSVGPTESEIVVRESEGARFTAEVEECGDRCRAKAFESCVVGPTMWTWCAGEVAHVYVYNAGLVEDCFPNKEAEIEWKVGEHFEDEDGFESF